MEVNHGRLRVKVESLALGDRIVEGMNTWSLDLAENIRATPETNLQLQTYTNLESRFTQIVPVTEFRL